MKMLISYIKHIAFVFTPDNKKVNKKEIILATMFTISNLSTLLYLS